jgi:putative phosphoesterase
MLVALGDTHIPGRAQKIPGALINEIKKVNPEKILFTGDAIIPSVIEELKKIAPVVSVRGNMDTVSAPKEEIIEWGGIRILLFHGTGILPRGDHEQLETIAKEKECRVIVTGHTHKPEIWKGRKVVILNPGSATGAWGGSSEEGIPTIMFLESNKKLLRVTLISLVISDLKRRSWNLDLSRIY